MDHYVGTYPQSVLHCVDLSMRRHNSLCKFSTTHQRVHPYLAIHGLSPFYLLFSGGCATQQVLKSGDHRRWELVTVDDYRQKGYAPSICHNIIKHPAFHVLVMTVTVANAIVTATISFKYTHDNKSRSLYLGN